jgi:beta-glucosidase/6-phospho-beta-glucosidase/beta-galactosidase
MYSKTEPPRHTQDVGGPYGWACTYNVIAAHAAAVQKFRETTIGKIGMALDIEWVVPASQSSEDQVRVTTRQRVHWGRGKGSAFQRNTCSTISRHDRADCGS